MLENLVFAGQGALDGKPLLNRELYASHEGVRRVYDVAREVTGLNVKDISLCCLLAEQRQHPQILPYVQHMAAYLLLTGRLKVDKNETIDLGYYHPPQILTGFSLGMFSAFTAGGAWDYRKGLRIVEDRESIMKNAKGILKAVVGNLDKAYLDQLCIPNQLEIAMFKGNGNYSLGGCEGEVTKAINRIRQDGRLKKEVPTPVQGAIHTSFLQEEAKQFALKLYYGDRSLRMPSIPVVATDENGTILQLDGSGNNDGFFQILGYLKDHMDHPVHLDTAIRKIDGDNYTVVGKGADSVANMISWIFKGVKKVNTEVIDDLDKAFAAAPKLEFA